ncbi:MAG: PEP/pyruvate-binding domain-containing protein, partial [Patescibacteria group bacterium]|nr:PEP/pyruvate-binding domain-containing protein [Patescibacteria group bacterium]
MSIVNPAPQFLKMPKLEVGTYALDLADLAAKEIPLPTTYCLPVSTLKNIAKHNWLEDKFEQIGVKIIPGNRLQIDQALKKIRSLILQQTIPKKITKKLFSFYQQKLNQDFVRLTASPVSGFNTNYKREDNIRGEVNLIESILKLWARNIGEKELLQRNLFPVAIVIQEQPQPISSGIAYSQNPKTGDKTQLIINSTWGVYQANSNDDQITVDQRSWRIIDQTINKKNYYYKRELDRLIKEKTAQQNIKKPSLSEKQTKKLAKLIKKIK